MKVIIAGSRTITSTQGNELIRAAAHVAASLGWVITEVVCGEARGIDACGRHWAERRGIPVKSFPADWDQFGNRAGFMRNEQMGEYGEGLIAITNGSPGTRNMIQIARAKKMPVIVIEIA